MGLAETNGNQEESALLEIPILSLGTKVVLYEDELPGTDTQDWEELLILLRAELPPFDVWKRLGVSTMKIIVGGGGGKSVGRDKWQRGMVAGHTR